MIIYTKKQLFCSVLNVIVRKRTLILKSERITYIEF